MHGQEVRLSVGPGIRYERRSKKLIQIHNPWDNLVDILKKKRTQGSHTMYPPSGYSRGLSQFKEEN